MPLALVNGIKDSEAEPHLVKQLLYSGIAGAGTRDTVTAQKMYYAGAI